MFKTILKKFSKRVLVLAALAAIVIPWSATNSVAVTPVSASDLKNLLSGRSWLWKAEGVGAGIYFGPGGKGTVSLGGNVRNITWYTENGKVCYRGNGSSCWLVYIVGSSYFSKSTRGGSPYKWHPRRSTRSGNHIF